MVMNSTSTACFRSDSLCSSAVHVCLLSFSHCQQFFFLSGTHPNSRVPNMHITVCNQCIDYFLKSAFYMAYIVHFKMMKQVHLTETVWNACTKNGTKAKLLIWFLHPIDWMHRSTLNGLFSICIVYLNDLCIIYYYIVTQKKNCCYLIWSCTLICSDR